MKKIFVLFFSIFFVFLSNRDANYVIFVNLFGIKPLSFIFTQLVHFLQSKIAEYWLYLAL